MKTKKSNGGGMPTLTIRIPDELRAELQKEADADDRTLSAYILRILEGKTKRPSKS